MEAIFSKIAANLTFRVFRDRHTSCDLCPPTEQLCQTPSSAPSAVQKQHKRGHLWLKLQQKQGPISQRSHLAHDTSWAAYRQRAHSYRDVQLDFHIPDASTRLPLSHSIPRCHASLWRWWRSTTPRSPNTGTAARTVFRDNWKLVSSASTYQDAHTTHAQKHKLKNSLHITGTCI